MSTQANATAADIEPRDEWPDPTDEQLAMIRRILAPHIHQARADRGAEQSAA
ncbi:hypothetical protein ACIBCO_36255 [Streptomyces violascens]|uniref:hypothetical protein n=1 Tax=Streptomyces violascens TaxID=67381 RepID=UPI0037B536C1